MAVAEDDAGRARLRADDYRGDQTAIERLGLEGQALLTEIYGLYQQEALPLRLEKRMQTTDFGRGPPCS